MKRSSINIQLTAFLLLLAGCTQGEPFPGEGDGTNGARTALLRLSSVRTVAGEGSATRAEVGTTPLTKGSIGFFVKKDAANGYAEKTNIEGTLSATSGKWEPTSEIWLNEKNATIGIYAPYDKTGQTTPNVLKLNASLRPDDASKDLWCARLTDVSFTNSAPAPTLDHVYTRCVVNVSRAASNKQQAEITGMSFASTEVYSSADYKLFEASGNYDYSKSVAGFTVPGLTAQTLTDANPQATYDLLLIPSALTKEVVLQLTVNSRKMRVSIPAVKFDNALERGKKYTLNVTLTPSELTLSSLQYTDWDDTTPPVDVDGAAVEYYDVGCSVYFAPGNLIATEIGTTGEYTYSFRKNQRHDNSSNMKGYGGDYFYWNQLKPASKNHDAPVFEIGTWDDSNDPCRKVSPEWFTPSKEQLEELVSKDRAWGKYYISTSLSYYYGYFFGTAKAPEASASDFGLCDDFLFLSLAGTAGRVDSGTSVNASGWYMSTTPSGEVIDGHSCSYALRMDRYGFLMNPTIDSSAALPIRCVRYK